MSNKYEKPCAFLTFSTWLWFRSAQQWSSNGRHMQHTNQSKYQNCWYFVRPTQKNDSPKIEPKACIVTTWAPWSINKAKNVDISLDQSKKTILQKVCTLSSLGPCALVWRGSRQNCWKTIGFVTKAMQGVQGRQMSAAVINGTNCMEETLRCFGTYEGYIRLLTLWLSP